MLEIKNLKKSFDGHLVLDGISFELKRGDILAILGSSGGGKTTLLRILSGLELYDSGNILIDGKLFKDHKPGQIGLVAQGFHLFEHMTVLENITYAPKQVLKFSEDKAKEEAIDILNRLGLAQKVNEYPCELSGGQKQRVAIARALAMHPEVILYDEPTSALDPELTSDVAALIKSVAAREIISIIVTHDLQLAKVASQRVLFLDKGRIVEETPSDAFFKKPTSARAQRFLAGALIG